MYISKEDFDRAVKIANDAGKRGFDVNLTYIPPASATQANGVFVVDEYRTSASGTRER